MNPQSAVRLCRSLALFGYSLIVYDYFLSLPSELAFVWSARGGFIKHAFLVQRYAALTFGSISTIALMGILDIHHSTGNKLSVECCKASIIIQNIAIVPSATICNGIIMLRIASLWQKQRKILFSIIFLLFVTTIVPLVLITGLHLKKVLDIYDNPTMQWLIDQYPGVCTVNVPDKYELVAFSIMCLFDVYAFFAIIVNSFHHPHRSAVSWFRESNRDGLFYFMTLSLIRAMNLAMCFSHSPPLAQAANLMCWEIVTVLVGRFVLETREDGALLTQGQTQHQHVPLDSIDGFDPRRLTVDADLGHPDRLELELSPNALSTVYYLPNTDG